MKKRLQCLFLTLVLLASCFTVACSEEENVDTITINDGSNKNPATTVTIWGIRGENTTDEAVALVEKEMSALTQAEFNTALDLNLYTEDEYIAALEERLDEIAAQKKVEQAEADRLEAIAKLYKKNKAEEESETIPEDITSINEIGLVEVIYPEPDPAQLDIFYIPDYDTFVKYQADGHLSALDTELSSTGKLMVSYIHPNILSAGQLNNTTYAILNNKPIGEYTYLLLNRELLDKYYYDADDISIFSAADEFIMDVAANEPGIVPVLGEFDPIGVKYFSPDGEESVVGNMLAAGAKKGKSAYAVPTVLFTKTNYVDHVRQLKKYQSLGYLGDGTAEIGKFAVGVIRGDAAAAEKYKNKYEVKILQKPHVDNSVYADMFAISSYTKNITRSMEVLCAINTNPELRNIFAYGVRDVHYTLDENGVVKKLNNDYDTPLVYTGNMLITYPPEGSTPDVWEVCKAQNLELVDNPYFGFFYEDLVDEKLVNEVKEISKAYFAELDNVSYYNFDAWIANAAEELRANPTISEYTSFENQDGVAFHYNEWFFRLFPDAML
ncbi:MAG: hypothetical protein E7635_01555 [Ruminococcaceae bacterium]|nr:hypothetical protein [Oscillospiraceae bacterium]